MADSTTFQGGLADPVFGSQAVFRALMDTVAAPGTVAEFGAVAAAPYPLPPAAAAILLALADADTPVWLAQPDGAVAAWLRFHAGAPVTADPAAASFAVLSQGDDPAGWTRFALGTSDHPDRSTTLLLPVAALAGGAPLRLRGPGIERERVAAPLGLPVGFAGAMAANRARFPLGFDLVLVSGTVALALPRTTQIEEA